MADTSTQEKSPDSRISVVGRKRDLQDSLQYRGSVDAASSSDEERSRKRVKGTHTPSNNTSVGDDLALDVSSHLLAQQPPDIGVAEPSISQHEKYVFQLSREASDKTQTFQEATQSTLDPLECEAGESRSQAEVQSNAMPATWNQGVQSGLRTSFGSKSKPRRAPPKSSIPGESEDNRRSPLPSAMQLDVPMRLDRFQTRSERVPGRSDGENGAIMSDGNSSTNSQPVQVDVLALPAQIEVLSNEKASVHQESQAPIPESQNSPKTERRETQAELRQSDLSPAEDSDSEGEASYSNGINQPGGSSTRSYPVSAPPEKFNSLSKKALKRLPIPEQHAYTAALAAHLAEKREAKAIRKAREAATAVAEALRNLLNGGKAKKLSQGQLDLLDPQKREEYLAAFEMAEANRAERQRSLLEDATRAAAALLAEGVRPPFPEHHEIAEKIAKGFTSYPRNCKQIYKNRFGDFNLSEVLDQGKPIHIEQFSFNVFAPAFLANNRDKWDVMSQRILVSAFTIYIGGFYGHVLGTAEWLRSTATAHDALTLEQAKRQAQIGRSEDSNASSAAFKTSGDGGQSSNRGNMTSVHPLSSAEVIEQPEKPNTRDWAQEPLKSSDAPASLDLSDDGRARIAGGIHRNSPVPELDMGQTPREDNDRTMADVVQVDAIGNKSSREEADSMDFDIDEAELFLQQKYFPSGTISASSRCVSCGQVGHNSSTCPALSCTSCGTFGKHSTASCPLNVRCGKCRERGHPVEDCPEKLARSRGEAVACDLCGSKGHLEIACHYIWRSFEPKPEEIRRVRDIPVYCYTCGAIDHYGPECGLHRGQILSGGNTWSKINLQNYLDPVSQERALSAGIDYSPPGRSSKQFSIKGKANDPIQLDDSDDETFIRPKVYPPVQNGHIRFGRSNEDDLPRRSYENVPPRSRGLDDMQSTSGDMSYRPTQYSQQPNSYRPSGLPQGVSLSMRGPNNGGGGKKGPNLKKGGPAEPGKKKRNRITKAEKVRVRNEAKTRNRS